MSKNVWITGASSGIGRALAIKFANEGWQVAASARRENLLKDLSIQNPNIHPFSLDVKNEDETKNIFQNIIKKFETIDALFLFKLPSKFLIISVTATRFKT